MPRPKKSAVPVHLRSPQIEAFSYGCGLRAAYHVVASEDESGEVEEITKALEILDRMIGGVEGYGWAASGPEPDIYKVSPWEIPVGDEQAPEEQEPETVRLQRVRPGEYYYPPGVDHPRYVVQNPNLMGTDMSLTGAGSENRWYLYSDGRLMRSFGTLSEVREWLAENADPYRLELKR